MKVYRDQLDSAGESQLCFLVSSSLLASSKRVGGKGQRFLPSDLLRCVLRRRRVERRTREKKETPFRCTLQLFRCWFSWIVGDIGWRGIICIGLPYCSKTWYRFLLRRINGETIWRCIHLSIQYCVSLQNWRHEDSIVAYSRILMPYSMTTGTKVYVNLAHLQNGTSVYKILYNMNTPSTSVVK